MSMYIQNQLYFSKRDGLHSISTKFDFDAYRNRIIFVEKGISIADEIHVYSNLSTKYTTPLGNKNLFGKKRTENSSQMTLITNLFLLLVKINFWYIQGVRIMGCKTYWKR